MERHSHPEHGFFPGHHDNANVSGSLFAYLVASRHDISSRRCCPFPKYPCHRKCNCQTC
ncbi:hypothetical protein CASFOL_017706 [Castilleja foliolosa]|uniref:Uncharacterized protein n=1 Tax=Castilleja foliolosa TaxID=1961234 RepID=A0ABD3DBR1_9LAMI